MSALLYLVGLVAAAVLIGVGVTVVHHRGYVAGQDERTAYYAPLIQAANAAKDAANARADRIDQGAQAITRQSEADHALLTQTLTDRVTAANARIAAILRQRAASDAAAGRCELPTVPGLTTGAPGAGAGDGRDQLFSDSISDVGRRCEHDAREVAEFQLWYTREKRNATAAPVTPP